MTPSRWQKIQRLFLEAKDLGGPNRAAYLDEACGGDLALRREVESLLHYSGRSTAFLGIVSTGGKQMVAHYRIERQIGRGGMGLVYQAWDTKLERWVAVKFLPPWTVVDPSWRRRFLEEARHASMLTHPNIVTIHEIGQTPDVDFIVMEFISGETLRDLIPSGGLPARRAVTYALEITSALALAHKRGLIHRDLKPSNIMVTDQSRIKLLDFGLAVPMTELPPHAQPFGTSDYMAPEQEACKPDARSDIYGIGLVLFEMLTGKHAFVRKGRRSPQSNAPGPPAPRRPKKTTPAALAKIVTRCLEQDPSKRFQSAEDLITALHASLAAANGGDRPLPPELLAEELSVDLSPDVIAVRTHLTRITYASYSESLSAVGKIKTALAAHDRLATATVIQRVTA